MTQDLLLLLLVPSKIKLKKMSGIWDRRRRVRQDANSFRFFFVERKEPQQTTNEDDEDDEQKKK